MLIFFLFKQMQRKPFPFFVGPFSSGHGSTFNKMQDCLPVFGDVENSHKVKQSTQETYSWAEHEAVL